MLLKDRCSQGDDIDVQPFVIRERNDATRRPRSGEQLTGREMGSRCRRVAISRTRLGRLVLEETGLDFRSWRRVFRMKHAVQELVGVTEHVRQIAFRVGYTDHGQFDHEFRQMFGLSPTEFRRVVATPEPSPPGRYSTPPQHT